MLCLGLTIAFLSLVQGQEVFQTDSNPVGLSSSGGKFACPHEFGFYPHEIACDKYYACDAGLAKVKTCGNGLAFDDSDPDFLTENCDYAHNVDCSTRPERAPPISTANCPYLFGIFPDNADCTVFWSCWNGEASRYTCGPGLAYDTTSRICTWMDKVDTCQKQREAQAKVYSCPAAGELVASGSFTRHAHPDDCRQYYVCFDGVPREYGCPIGTVFQIGEQDGFGQCSDPKHVPGCTDYYGDLDLKILKGLGHSGASLTTRPKQSVSGPNVRARRPINESAQNSHSTIATQE